MDTINAQTIVDRANLSADPLADITDTTREIAHVVCDDIAKGAVLPDTMNAVVLGEPVTIKIADVLIRPGEKNVSVRMRDGSIITAYSAFVEVPVSA